MTPINVNITNVNTTTTISPYQNCTTSHPPVPSQPTPTHNGIIPPSTNQNHHTALHLQPSPIYSGELTSSINAVYQTALQLLRLGQQPTYPLIATLTHTILPENIVNSIIEGALRPLPLPPRHSRDPIDEHIRKVLITHRTVVSLQREQAFVRKVRALHPSLLDEGQQRKCWSEGMSDTSTTGDYQQSSSSSSTCTTTPTPTPTVTPDILFPGPEAVTIAGVQCRWIEYKAGFGFRKNPFVYEKTVKQVRRYVDLLRGPGLVVYGLGFEEGLMEGVEGVGCAREEDVKRWLKEEEGKGRKWKGGIGDGDGDVV